MAYRQLIKKSPFQIEMLIILGRTFLDNHNCILTLCGRSQIISIIFSVNVSKKEVFFGKKILEGSVPTASGSTPSTSGASAKKRRSRKSKQADEDKELIARLKAGNDPNRNDRQREKFKELENCKWSYIRAIRLTSPLPAYFFGGRGATPPFIFQTE